ncbi:hypothetical protein QL285_042419 [Trifolium repens]|nr:hypothetical protein QL285_042419 [Trifolium repens]
MMTCLFVGPKNSLDLKNLTDITIVRCDKLKIAFSISILRFLPQLLYLTIKECKELEHIIEDDDDDLENKNISRTCFPKLKTLVVIKCNKLKFVFSNSMLRFLPQLRHLKIEECKELEHIIDDDLENKKNSNSLSSTTCFPKLETLVVIKCNKLKYVFPFSVCKELPGLNVLLITEANELEEIFKSQDDQKVDIPNLNVLAFDMLPSLSCAQGNQFQAVKNRFVRNCCQKPTLTSASTTNTFKEIDKLFISRELSKILRSLFEQLPSSETTEHFDAGIGAQATLEHKPDLTSFENDGIEQLPNVETTEDFELPSIQNVPSLTILPTNSELKGSTLEKTPVATVSTISGTKDELPIQIVAPNQKGIEIEGTSKTNNDQVSLNDDAFIKVNLNVGEQFSKSKLSLNITSAIASQFPSIPCKGDPFLVKRELEELVSKNHLNYENLSLLTDFFVKNPSVRLKDTSLPNRYKGCAYNLLAELLKFLETHSLLEVSGSCHSEFVELLQDARYFAFNKEWLDGVESRALFSEIQVSPDALEKLLDSKKRVTKDVEDLRLKIDVLSQVAEDLKHQLTSSEAELESIIQQEAVLSAPIGY